MRLSPARVLRSLSIVLLVSGFAGIAEAQIVRRDGILSGLAERYSEPFGFGFEMSAAGPLGMRWREFQMGVSENGTALAICRFVPHHCTPAQSRLNAIIDSVRNLDGRARLGIANREINLAIAYTSDSRHHGVPDVWSSALNTFESGQGDCEDFAIAKYVVLREAGVPAADLRLLIGRLTASDTGHAVLAARLDGRWLILDNRRMTMIEDIHIRDMHPLFAFDLAGVKQYGAPGTQVAATAARRQ